MKKRRRQQLLNIVKTLKEAHCIVGEYASSSDENNAFMLLEQCQQSAIQLGQVVEEEEGEGHIVIKELEKYCEELYVVANEMLGKYTGKEVVECLDDSLASVECCIKENISERIEIVFLPYKASMWDSMESIWKAARNDSKCDCYVVPIPYFTKKDDGTFGELHYEGELFSKEIEITNYEHYNLEQRHPDAVFIHNGYDSMNHVTSVHPHYYSTNLKKYTDFLAYVSYGIGYEFGKYIFNPKNNLFLLPAVLNADAQYVFSRDVAEQMTDRIYSIVNYCGYSVSRDDVAKRIIPMGSPKFDKVINDKKRELYNIPEEWKTQIGDKKVILFNTSIKACLNNTENYLEKLKKTLKVFEMNKSEMTLWWRPHPLLLDTMKSMRPHLADEYNSIREEYICKKWGILDETSEINRAIAWADAYYGDESSVMFLCMAAGKIMSTSEQLDDSAMIKEIKDFSEILEARILNMRQAKGANIHSRWARINWKNFATFDVRNNIQYVHFLESYIHYVVHDNEFLQTEEYKLLCKQLVDDFVENTDGSAGRHIYEHCKEMVLSK